MARPSIPVPNVRIISRFGSIATCRIPKQCIQKVRSAENVLSLKASTKLAPDIEIKVSEKKQFSAKRANKIAPRRPKKLKQTGKGVIVGIIDWDCDYVHPDFRNSDGTTRILALWDQRGGQNKMSTNHYGYGRIHSQDRIDWAMNQTNPYQALGYNLAKASHGSHVMGIAVGNGQGRWT